MGVQTFFDHRQETIPLFRILKIRYAEMTAFVDELCKILIRIGE